MYYIMTADRLTRTARWLEKTEGGIKYLRKVVVEDYLSIGKELEEHMKQLIGTYQCEWTTVVRDPQRRKLFGEFVNTVESDGNLIEMQNERGQRRPVDWPKEVPSLPTLNSYEASDANNMSWLDVGSTDLFPSDEGRVVRVGTVQIAVFHVGNQWYATQNMCPHKRALVLASGILGTDNQQRTYVSCPMHKKNFDITNGACLVPGEKEKYRLSTFNVKIEDGQVNLLLPSVEILNEALGTANTIVTKFLKSSNPAVVKFEEASSCGVTGSTKCGDNSLDW
jgi:nitrite reductase (NAD(P)H)